MLGSPRRALVRGLNIHCVPRMLSPAGAILGCELLAGEAQSAGRFALGEQPLDDSRRHHQACDAPEGRG